MSGQTLPLGLSEAKPLPKFLNGRAVTSTAERRLIVEQAIGILEHVYVHLPVKLALHGIDPLAELRALRTDPITVGDADDTAFHREMVGIMNEFRDKHTAYYLPRPFDRAVAFLPFQVEVFYDNGKRRVIVPRVLPGTPEINAAMDFEPGVEVTGWDGDPIEDAILREGNASPGINAGAREALGIYRLTTRLLAKCPAPERETVTVTYRRPDGTERPLQAIWRAYTLPPALQIMPEGTPIGTAPGLDAEAEVYRALKQELEARHREETGQAHPAGPALETSLPAVFEARSRVVSGGRTFGHLRIRSFSVTDAAGACDECVRLIGALPEEGLIIDIRDNPGGSIRMAEMILDALAGRRLPRAPLLFRTTPFIARLCQHRHDLYERWLPGLARAQATRAVYSAGVPLWPDAEDPVPPCPQRPLVLVVNALTYSAADFFSAGFQDNQLGPILGVHRTTGGGGANVCMLRDLAVQVGADRDRFDDLWVPVPLAAGADIHAAFRRSVRVGHHAGMEVEDFGIVPDHQPYHMTRRDTLESNPDLFEAAVGLLRPPH